MERSLLGTAVVRVGMHDTLACVQARGSGGMSHQENSFRSDQRHYTNFQLLGGGGGGGRGEFQPPLPHEILMHDYFHHVHGGQSCIKTVVALLNPVLSIGLIVKQ